MRLLNSSAYLASALIRAMAGMNRASRKASSDRTVNS
jgi:hypothetical protein